MKGKRSKLTITGAKRLFKKTSGVHKLNKMPLPMRGGIAL